MVNLHVSFMILLLAALAPWQAAAAPAAPSVNPYLPDGINVRMITLASPFTNPEKTAIWMLPNHTAQDVLQCITELKPDCLERFVTGKQDPGRQVPVAAGEKTMTVLQFLNAAQAAGNPRCIIVPKLNLQWREDYFFEAAQNLYNLPLDRPIRSINLDCWPDYWKFHTPAQIKAMLQRLKAIGFKVIGINMTGGYHEGYGYVDYMDFNIDKTTWTVNERALNRLKGDPALKKYFMYIDYPRPMDEFVANHTVDEQADIYVQRIHCRQVPDGFTFVYPIFQDDWDATRQRTSAGGPYRGKSMYEITRELIEQSRGRTQSTIQP